MSESGVHELFRLGGDSLASVLGPPAPLSYVAGGGAASEDDEEPASTEGAASASCGGGEDASAVDGGSFVPPDPESSRGCGGPESSAFAPESSTMGEFSAGCPSPGGAPAHAADQAAESAITKEMTLDSPQNDGLRMPG